MSTVADYLQWRGDIPFDRMPVNEVDAYLLAKIGAPDLSGIVPAEGEGIPLREAYARYFARTDIDPDYFGKLIPAEQVRNLRRLMETDRFKDLILSDYLEKISEKRTEQISALTLTIPGGPTVVTFRGTDDTIVGWKENFLLAVQGTVAAQRDALRYLTRVAETHPGELMVMGHSKGGNLSVYASVSAPKEIRDRISRVINFDGPGFREEFWHTPEAVEMTPRIENYMSQYAMVGALMTQSGPAEICRSTRSGPLAHEVMFWEVKGPSFVREPKREPSSEEFGHLINTRMDQMTDEEIERVVEDIFGVLMSGGATTLTQLVRQNVDQTARMVREIAGSDSVRELCRGLAETFFTRDNLLFAIRRRHAPSDNKRDTLQQ